MAAKLAVEAEELAAMRPLVVSRLPEFVEEEHVVREWGASTQQLLGSRQLPARMREVRRSSDIPAVMGEVAGTKGV